jgi:hypothetical protein
MALAPTATPVPAGAPGPLAVAVAGEDIDDLESNERTSPHCISSWAASEPHKFALLLLSGEEEEEKVFIVELFFGFGFCTTRRNS